MAEQQQDVDTLKRRGRRRLVGAVALVLLAVIVLPMVFDPEPRRTPPPVSVRIPGEEDGTFTPKPATKPAPAPAAKVEEKKDVPAKSEEKAPAPVAKKPDAKKAPPKAEAKSAELTRAEAALSGSEYMVPVGAFANVDPVLAKLSAAKIPYYTQIVATASGPVTRVRAGPFGSQAEAEKVAQALKGLGFKPGSVGAKSG